MNKFDDLLKSLSSLEIEQTELDLVENIPQEIYDKHFEGLEEVCCDLDRASHRYYDISTTVLKIYDRFLGIRGVTELKSQNMDIGDCAVEIEFFEMEEIKITSYERRNNK